MTLPGWAAGAAGPGPVAALGAWGVATSAWGLLVRHPPAGRARWMRTNYRGSEVSLLEGPAAVLGAAASLASVPGAPRRTRVAAWGTVVACGALGLYDDLVGSGARRGFRGHLGALRHGEVTSGALKILGIGTAGATAAMVMRGRSWEVLPAAVVVAGSANLLNLLDLRPGRAAKVAVACAAPLLVWPASRTVGGAALGAAAAVLPADLSEAGMLGDCGANALGGALGVAAAAMASRAQLLTLAAVLVGLTAASERVSFSTVIASMEPLSRFDDWGRSIPVHAPPER